MLASSNIISKRLNNLQFGYYDPEEIRRLSVKEIKNAKAFDQLNNPIKGGLYDPALGVQPHDRGTRCVTCGQEFFECTGHIGHIELLLPVYNPFLVNKLLSLLRSKCFFCHHLRITSERKKYYKTKFKLLKLGQLIEMREFENLSTQKKKVMRSLGTKLNQASRKGSGDTTTKALSEKSLERPKEKNVEQMTPKQQEQQYNDTMKQQQYDQIRARMKEIMGLTKVKQHPERYSKGIIETSHIQYEIKILTKQFYKDINKKCPHCKKPSQIVRKEGLSKFFLVDRSIKTSKTTDVIISQTDINDQGAKQEQDKKPKKPRQQYMSPLEVFEHMKLLWDFDDDILKFLFGTLYIDENTLQERKKGYDLVRFKPCNFFVEVLPITANRFRPENKLGDQTFLHGHTVSYTKVLEINQELRQAIIKMDGNSQAARLAATESVPTHELKNKSEKELKRIITLEGVFQKWIELQDCVVGLFNSEKAQSKENRENNGVKQLLERKQGLFRMKMMGKRVNFACRSVISPDPLLNTNEVGVPLILARKLMIPENVNQHNFAQLGELVMNGPQKYPGAMYYEEGGHKTSLEFLSPQQRLGIVRELGSGYNKVVWRQLKTGDVMLFNRQPTLHKPSIMAHIARVLPNEQTIRFHYANCKSYNADFDGDEMNLHFLQSYVARAEAYYLALSDQQYISPTNGKPIRELIQDMIVSAVFLTMRDTFLTRQEFQQLLYVAVWNLFYQGEAYSQMKRIEYAPPAILKPKELWTGKQLITSIMKIIVKRGGYDPDIGLNVEAKAQIGKNELPGCAADDIQVLVKDNELLLGILDKKQLGAGADYGYFINELCSLIHAFHELYGASLTGQLLSGLCRLFAAFLQMHGFTCGMDDLKVEKVFDEKRIDLIQENLQLGLKAATNYCGYTKLRLPQQIDLMNRPDYVLNAQGQYEGRPKQPNVDYLVDSHRAYQFLEHKLLTDRTADEALDAEYKKAMSKKSSEIVQNTLLGLQKRFPRNMFSCMTISGAKGSNVNHSQVSVQLGQQELEGRRVPVMPSGRTLPSFIPYDPNPRAGGYIGDRFLTGLRPQEFFFHCMAGREGLIDTAVKTSRSGYLQRCLIKHLEGLVVQYDLSVRDNDGSMIQVFYGEDGIDTTKTKYLERYGFLEQNASSFKEKYRVNELKKKLDSTSVPKFLSTRHDTQDTIMSHYSPACYLGAVSEKSLESQTAFIRDSKSDKKILTRLSQMRYLYSLAQPGEAVGCIAAQSIGEPSTQMTLNTFHLAGHGEKNVTLGIPRLREILMTATKKQKTPTMSLQFNDKEVTKLQAERYARRLSKLVLLELVKQIRVVEYKRLSEKGTPLASHLRGVIYEIQIVFEDLEAIDYSFGVTQAKINNKVMREFVPLLIKFIDSELKKDSSRMNEKTSYLLKKPQSEMKKKKNQDDEDQDNGSIPSDDLNMSGDEEAKDDEVGGGNKPPQFNISSNTARYLEDIEFGAQDAKITIKLPLNTKKILMTNIVKKSLLTTVVQEIRGIQKAKVLKNDKQGASPFYIFTEGVNLRAARGLDFIETNKIESNDIGAILDTFGIEAARKSIINEILSVFNAYAVAVDYRHLYLIGDYMTFGGVIRAMNRIWIDYNTSPFLKMSFETSTQFLSNVCTQRQHDDLSSISSQLVVGKVPRVGTGLCDVFYSVPQVDEEEEEQDEDDQP